MKLITELTETVNYITEDNDGKKSLFIEGIFLQGNIKNRNGRMYSTEILDKEVQRYNTESIAKGRAYGELGHPEGPGINLDRVSHIITELKRSGDNFIGKAKISSTPMGKIAAGLIEDGAQLGVSSRGMGSLKQGKDGVMEVQGDFHLATAADIVADPSAPDAFVNGIMEGVDWVWNNGKFSEQRAEDVKMQIEEAARKKKLNEQAMINAFQSFLNKIS